MPTEEVITAIAEDKPTQELVVLNEEPQLEQEPTVEPIEESVVEPPVEPVEQDEFAGKGKQELVEYFALAVGERPVEQLRLVVEKLKIAFYKIYNAEVEAQKAAWQGEAEEFVPAADAAEAQLKELLTVYRNKRDAFLAGAELEKESNYKLKLAVIEELKELTTGSETLHNTFVAFRELQNRWKDIGLVPQERVRDLWDTYNHHIENFYNYIKINKELRDLDLKRNYEAKVELCEQAEALLLDASAVAGFRKLQKLHEAWREAGPVAIEFKEQLWERFKEASGRVNKRHQEHFDGLKQEQEANLLLKQELCNKVEELSGRAFTTRKEWIEAAEQISQMQKVWRTIGFTPRKDNNSVWENFRAACDKFFEAKRTYFEGQKDEFAENYQAKLDLCLQAEKLCENDDWKATTEALMELQKQWKTIGVTSRKNSDAVWKRFRAACDKFFERKSSHFEGVDSQYNENLEAKRAILQQLKDIDRAALNFDTLKELQRSWSAIGFVPIKQKESLNKEYKTLVDELFDALRGNESGRRVEQFKERAAALHNTGRASSEREKLYHKVRQLEAEIQTLENNIGFFGKSKGAALLIKGVQSKIDKAKAEIAEIIEKVKLIDQQ